MSIPLTVRNYLEASNVQFTSTVHAPSATATQAAEAAHVSGEKLAKGVVLADDEGFVLAVVPSTHVLRVVEFGKELGRDLDLADEDEFRALFPDCELGAVPAIGPAYGIRTVVADSLLEEDDVWFEAGDHVTLVHVDGPDFRRLLADAGHTEATSHRH
jgi:Ala-tRNA(Pro) deacylase